MTISEKVAYIQGLYDGLGLDGEKSGEARILSEVLDVLKEVGLQLDGMDAAMDQFDEELDTLGDTVAELEEAVFDDEDEDDGDFEDSGDTDEDFFEVPCPSCGENLIVDDETLAAGVVDCPVCGGKFAISFEDSEEFTCPDCGEKLEPDGAELDAGVAFCSHCGKNVRIT